MSLGERGVDAAELLEVAIVFLGEQFGDGGSGALLYLDQARSVALGFSGNLRRGEVVQRRPIPEGGRHEPP